MGATITLAGESLIAQKQAAKQILNAARFILANVPGLDPEQPVDRAAGKPPVAQIVGAFDVTQAGYVNPNQVVYSVMLGSDIGDFDWNWIGLETVDGVLLMVAYVPLQQKRRNQLPQQIGNNVTRNFLLMFDGAKALTGVTVDASTWQHDFTVRLAGIDERQRLANREMFGRACYFGPSLSLKRVGNVLRLEPGTAYVEGIRVVQPAAIDFPVPAEPTSFWLDVSMQRHLSNVIASWQFITNPDKTDYIDEAGVIHYRVMLASWIDKTLLDTRSVEPIDGPLVEHFAARAGDYAKLRARATTKEDVKLENLPNAKSDDPSTNSSEILATTAALNNLKQQVWDSMTGMVAPFAMPAAPAGWLKCNGATVSRKTFAQLFDRIGTRYGAGDGVTTFGLPDLRGEFVRGWDDARGLDPSRGLGSVQAGQNASHVHTASAAVSGLHSHPGAATSSDGAHTHTGSTTQNGNHSHLFNHINTPTSADRPGVGAALHYSALGWTADNRIQAAGDHTHGLNIDSAGAHAHGVTVPQDGAHSHAITVDASGGAEARPRNIALLYCIKY